MTGRGYILGYPLKLLCLCTELKGSNFNIRILYAFLPDGAPILLVGFGERSGKRVSSCREEKGEKQETVCSLPEKRNKK